MCLHSKKLDPRGVKGIFIGYEQGVKGYKILLLDSHQIVITRNVVFYENIFPMLNENEVPSDPPHVSASSPLTTYGDCTDKDQVLQPHDPTPDNDKVLQPHDPTLASTLEPPIGSSSSSEFSEQNQLDFTSPQSHQQLLPLYLEHPDQSGM